MKIKKYIYSLLIGKIIFATLVLAAILWTTKALKLLDSIAIKGVRFIDFLKLSACLLPYIVYLILPFSTLISFAVVYKLLDQDNELLVLKLSGIKKSKLISPFLEVFAIFTGLGLLISVFLIPVSYQKFQQIILNYQNYYLATFIDEKSFNSDISGITFYINEKNGDSFEGVFINDHRSADKEISIFAELGVLSVENGMPVFTLHHGIQFERSLKDNTNSSVSNDIVSNLKFDVYKLVFDYKQALKTIKKVEHQELKIKELLHASKLEDYYNTYVTEGIKRLLWPCFTFILPLLFLSIAINAKFSRKIRYFPIVLSFVLPFTFMLINVYTISFATNNWHIMIPILCMNFAVAVFAYFAACSQNLSFKI